MTESAAIADDRFYELVDGQVVMEKPPPGANEAWIATTLSAWVYQCGGRWAGWVVNEGLFLLDPARPLKRRPNVAFNSHKRWARRKLRPVGEAWEVVPDLAVEVISKGTKAAGIVARVDEYFQTGVRLVWVIYALHQKVYVYTSPTELQILRSGDELDGGAVIPGFRMPVKTLFGDDD